MYTLPPPDASVPLENEDRKRWMAQWVQMGMKVRQDESCVWVGRRIDWKGADGETSWIEVGNGKPLVPIHLRTVLLNSFCFDLGDNREDKSPTPWSDTREYAHGIFAACTQLGIPILASLSGGKGFHIEVFLTPNAPTLVRRGLRQDPKDDWRWPIALRIVGLANQILYGDTLLSKKAIEFDPLLIAPGEGSRLVREFGERKGPAEPYRKMLWHEGLGPVEPLPESRTEAYAQAELKAKARGSVRPTSIPVASGAKRLDTRWASALLGRPCPTSPTCLQSPCADCPVQEMFPLQVGGCTSPAIAMQ